MMKQSKVKEERDDDEFQRSSQDKEESDEK